MRRLALLAVMMGVVAAPGCAMSDPGARTVRAIPMPTNSTPSDQIEARLLAAHNAERAKAGTPPLVWDDQLEAEAQVWATALIARDAFEHDPAQHGHGENLWSGWSPSGRVYTPEDMLGDWIAEKADYRHDAFPQVSRTGNWADVSHYTQVIWRTTTHVGCALAARGDRTVLACRYAPPGNIDGRRAF
ncbi:MAG: CAP domain-containing protein [Brevundimonas sp.]